MNESSSRKTDGLDLFNDIGRDTKDVFGDDTTGRDTIEGLQCQNYHREMMNLPSEVQENKDELLGEKLRHDESNRSLNKGRTSNPNE